MRVELKHIKGDVLEQEFSCRGTDFPEIAALMAAGTLDYDGPIRFVLRFQQSGRIVEVRGRVEAIMCLACGRCLGGFNLPLVEEFSLTFTPQTADDPTADDYQLASDELDLIPYQDECLELMEPLQEQLLMAVPISVLCRDNCRGLCRECGADLNQQGCSCDLKPFNNKFGTLAQMKLRSKDSSR